MPRRAMLTREKILEAAVEEVREKGWDALNARRLAKRLNCSTSPLFACFSGMEELRAAVKGRATEIYSAYIDEGMKEERKFKGIGRAYIRFAYAEPQLFRLLFMSREGGRPALPGGDPNSARVAEAASAASGLSGEKAKKLYLEMWIFVHGIAAMGATGTQTFSGKEISEMLTDAYRGICEGLKKS